MPREPSSPRSGHGLGVVSEPLFLHRGMGGGDSPLRTLTLAAGPEHSDSRAFSRPSPHHSAPRPHTCSQGRADIEAPCLAVTGRGTGVFPKGGCHQGREQEARQPPEATRDRAFTACPPGAVARLNTPTWTGSRAETQTEGDAHTGGLDSASAPPARAREPDRHPAAPGAQKAQAASTGPLTHWPPWRRRRLASSSTRFLRDRKDLM